MYVHNPICIPSENTWVHANPHILAPKVAIDPFQCQNPSCDIEHNTAFRMSTDHLLKDVYMNCHLCNLAMPAWFQSCQRVLLRSSIKLSHWHCWIILVWYALGGNFSQRLKAFDVRTQNITSQNTEILFDLWYYVMFIWEKIVSLHSLKISSGASTGKGWQWNSGAYSMQRVHLY